MKLSFAALKRWLDYDDSANACADDLASLGFPNDGIREIGAALDEVVLAKILKMEKHPQADRLWLLEVDTGKEKLPVVCGAKNMKVSDFVAFAPVGANLPTEDGGGFRIKKAKIRGVESQGMCCSEAEVGLAEESEGIWILPTRAVEASKAALGTKLSELFPWRDTVFELDVTPNRGDALSLRGIARELAAKCSLKLKTQRTARWKQGSSVVNPRVESFEDAQGFLGVLIEGVSLDETPDEWRRFLVAMGGRPLSPLVDVSNILLFEMGHPIHLFDADRVDAKTIGVRRAKPGETLELLNDETIELSAEDLVIADQSGPLSLAGVMGGKASAVTSETTRVLLEVACFDAKRIRATSRRHQLFSESSFRFERQLTAHRLDEIADRCLGLIQEMGGSFESASGNKSLSRSLSSITCLWSRDRVEAKLGKLPISDDEIFSKLRALEYEFEGSGQSIRVAFPWYRTDVEVLEDVMEDVARLVGYENLEKKSLSAEEGVFVFDDLQQEVRSGRKILKNFQAFGFVECLHSSFTNPDRESFFEFPEDSKIELQNPIHSEKSALRRSLIPQLLERARFNASKHEDEIRLVEEGPVFFATDSKASIYSDSPIRERWQLACVWYPRNSDQKRLWSQTTDPFFVFKGYLARIFFDLGLQAKSQEGQLGLYFPGRVMHFGFGEAGELHPRFVKDWGFSGRVFVGEWSLSLRESARSFQVDYEQPPIDLDVSLLVSKGIPMADLQSCFEQNKSGDCEWVRPYDIYESEELGSDKRAITFALRYRARERSLSMQEAQDAQQKLIGELLKSFPNGQVAVR